MFNGSDVTYIYDGSFDGLLTCVFESFSAKEIPDRIITPQTAQLSLFESKYIETDTKKCERVKNGIISKLGKTFIWFLERAYLTCLDEKEKYMVLMVHIGFRYGKKSLNMADNPVVDKLYKAVEYLSKEAHLHKEFLRFSIYNDVMYAQITPNNFVLPFVARHFVNRFPDENFTIYDKAHGAAFIYYEKRCEIADVQEFITPEPQSEEIKYRRLWKMFYHTIGIKSRKNPKCRMAHMPKRYWQNLTEFLWDKEFDNKLYFDSNGESFLSPP